MIRRSRLAISVLLLAGTSALAAAPPAAPLSGPIDARDRVALAGSVDPRVAGSRDLGTMDGTTVIHGVSLYFKPSPAQQAQLDALLAAQQTPGSPDFHAWLTPQQFGARFGLADAYLRMISAWLAAQGLAVREVSPARNRIAVDGTVAQLQSALGTEMHTFERAGELHFANAAPLQVPAALGGLLAGVRNLNDFRLKPRHLHGAAPAPDFTSSISGNHYLAPGDIVTIYDIAPLYAAGFTGAGRKLAIVGQTAIETADINAFRSAGGLPATTLTQVLVPNTGAATVVSGDIDESSLDLEWGGGVAPGATLVFVFTGNSSNNGVLDALKYAIDTKQAPVISISYGLCESGQSGPTGEGAVLQGQAQQANAQGQTIVASSGDAGAADCDAQSSVATGGLAVDLPASVPEVTGIGGSEFSGDVGSPATYWAATNTAANASALSYIPETTWNDTSGTLTASGGGSSALFAKPAWQKGTGVPADNARDVPDISFDASNRHDAYLYCVQGSCVNGYRRADNTLTAAGGTSFGAPIFAGVLTLLEQVVNSTGEGNFNPTFYTLAATAPTYAAAFHDIATGSNKVPCQAGSPDCVGGTLGYDATTGYDRATGLGSLDVTAFAQALPNSAVGVIQTTLAVAAPAGAIGVASAASFTATLTLLNTGKTAPGGTVQFSVDGNNLGAAVALAGTTAAKSISFNSTGSHTVGASYSGDASYAASSGAATVTVNAIPTTLAISGGAGGVMAGTATAYSARLTVTRNGPAAPGGTVQFLVDGVNAGAAVPLSAGTASANISIAAGGNHQVTAAYSGDALYAGSTATETVAVTAAQSSGSGGGGGGGSVPPIVLAALAALAAARRMCRLPPPSAAPQSSGRGT